MRIDHPYSLVVRDGDVAWSCGQCPLDEDGRVCAPGDLAAQTRYVARLIHIGLAGVGLAPIAIGKIVVYFVDAGADESRQMMSILRSAFGETPLILPLAVPHFYYDGMLIEVDVHAAGGTLARIEEQSPEVLLEGVVGDGLAWMNIVLARAALRPGSQTLRRRIDSSLAEFRLGTGDLLADHWFVDRQVDGAPLDVLADDGLIGDRCSVAQAGSSDGSSLVGELTFVRPGGADPAVRRHVSSHGVATVRTHGRYFWICGRSNTPAHGLVDQTRAAMQAIDTAMLDHGWRFDRVCKATSHYVGGSSEYDLHANMAVRNEYYRSPGPASTGLPVTGFPCSGGLVTVDVLGTVEPS